MEFLGVLLMLIGMLLIVNAVWLQGKVETTDVGYFNLIIGILAIFTSVYVALVSKASPLAAALSLFGVTYLWVGINCIRGATDQKALGFYCQLVAALCIPFAYKTYQSGDIIFALEWVGFCITWYLFYQLLYAGNAKIMKPLVSMVFIVGFAAGFTGWSMLYGYWPYITIGS